MAVTNKNNVIELTLAKKSRPVTVNVVSLETAVPYIFKLIDYTPDSGMSARIYIEKEDGHLVYNACTISGNEVTFTPTTQCFNVGKMATAQLQIMSGSKVALSYLIAFVIEENIINSSAIESTDEFTALQQLITSAEAYNGIIGANNITGYNNRQGWIALTSGQNLNSITAPGVYYCATNAIAASLLNCPTTRNFTMVVSYGLNNATYVTQRIMEGNTVYIGYEYKRSTNDRGSTWAVWQTLPLRSEVNAIANRGGKNIFQNLTASRTVNGLTVTPNADGTVTVSGTASADTDLFLQGSRTYPTKRAEYILSGSVNGSATTYMMGCRVSTSSGTKYYLDIQGGGLIDAEGTIDRVYINVKSGATLNDVTFYPMIRPASVQDDTYVPYSMSNAELTAGMTQLKFNIVGLTAATALPFVNGLHESATDTTWYRSVFNAPANSFGIAHAGTFYLEGYRDNANYGWQRMTTNSENASTAGTRVYSRTIYNGTWTDWA